MNLLVDFRWQDIIDIALLALISYRIILMLQGTRTVQIIIGFLVVGVVFYLSGIFGIAGVNWLLNNLFSSFIVVIIVLFQADVRNALAQMGTKTFFQKATPKASLDMLGRIYKVCEHLSKSKTGALIILEKSIGLAEFSKSATPLDAEFSERLLVTIFNTYGPLHDGAVIMDRNFQVAYAGAILPLTGNIDFSKDLGTRHRAALGLSEESDAIVLVVSEETGAISLAHKGKLFRTPVIDVKDKLMELYTKSARRIQKEEEQEEQEEQEAQKLGTKV